MKSGPETVTPPGQLFVVSAPSGAGKTTLIRQVIETGEAGPEPLAFSVSHTTRRPREGEVDGREYHFVEVAVFDAMIAAGQFLEWARVHGHSYGTAEDEVLPRLAGGLDVVLDIDVQGAEQVLRRLPDACGVFILPPSFGALAERLARRGLDDPADVGRRLDVSRWEIERYSSYRYVIINDDASRAGRVLAAIILAERHRRHRLASRVDEILRGFPPR